MTEKQWTVRLSDDDRSVTLRLAPKGKTKNRTVDLREPSAAELVRLQAALNAVEDALPPVTPLPPNPTAEDSLRNADEIKAQNRYVYGEGLPYAGVLLKLIETLKTSSGTYTMDDLVSSAVGPGAVRAALAHFKVPLVGPDALAAAIQAIREARTEETEPTTNGQTQPSTAPASPPT